MAVDVVIVVSCNVDDIVVHSCVTILRTSAHKKTCLRSVDLLVVQVHGQARLFVIAVDVVIVVSRLLSVFNQMVELDYVLSLLTLSLLSVAMQRPVQSL